MDSTWSVKDKRISSIQYIGPKEYQENFGGNTYNRSILHFITNLAASEAVGIEY